MFFQRLCSLMPRNTNIPDFKDSPVLNIPKNRHHHYNGSEVRDLATRTENRYEIDLCSNHIIDRAY